MHTGFYILKEVFFHVLVFKEFFLVLMFMNVLDIFYCSSVALTSLHQASVGN